MDISKLQTGIFHLGILEDLDVVLNMCEHVRGKNLPEPFLLYGCMFTNETLDIVIDQLLQVRYQICCNQLSRTT
jgi:hypothetical protein